jgi:hypothetical protein
VLYLKNKATRELIIALFFINSELLYLKNKATIELTIALFSINNKVLYLKNKATIVDPTGALAPAFSGNYSETLGNSPYAEFYRGL